MLRQLLSQLLSVSKQQQLTLFSLLCAAVTFGSIIYVSVQQSEHLRQTSQGTPFFTPPVVNPDTGEATELDDLIRHYKGEG